MPPPPNTRWYRTAVRCGHGRPMAVPAFAQRPGDAAPVSRPPALYVHRMVVDDGSRGSELGSALLDWAARRVRKTGKFWLRLDAWKSNPVLYRCYLDRGFSLVRVDDTPSDLSGACFQRSASVELHLGPDVIEDGAVKVSQ
ncbi:MAG: GNAT family N-acetyltransferase [Pseudonocardiaceae bacterium]